MSSGTRPPGTTTSKPSPPSSSPSPTSTSGIDSTSQPGRSPAPTSGDRGGLSALLVQRVDGGAHECPSGAVGGDGVELGVLLGGVGPVLELDDAQLGELVPQPAVAGVEQPEL